jgi:hypothetical protein
MPCKLISTVMNVSFKPLGPIKCPYNYNAVKWEQVEEIISTEKKI